MLLGVVLLQSSQPEDYRWCACVYVVRPDEPPSSQDITVSLSSYCSLSSALRIAENSQSPAVHFFTRTDSADCHMPSVVSRPSQLPMDNRRNSWTQGESTFDNMTTMFSPNFPLSQDIYTSSTTPPHLNVYFTILMCT